jgi:hypothetical protein
MWHCLVNLFNGFVFLALGGKMTPCCMKYSAIQIIKIKHFSYGFLKASTLIEKLFFIPPTNLHFHLKHEN